MINMQNQVLHYPNLRTVLIVEKVIQDSDTVVSKAELKRRLPAQIMHQTLNIVLEYLEDSGKIFDGRKGILWVYNPSKKIEKAIKEGIEL